MIPSDPERKPLSPRMKPVRPPANDHELLARIDASLHTIKVILQWWFLLTLLGAFLVFVSLAAEPTP